MSIFIRLAYLVKHVELWFTLLGMALDMPKTKVLWCCKCQMVFVTIGELSFTGGQDVLKTFSEALTKSKAT